MHSADVTVIGGGCVGLTAALGLAQNGFKVIVIDKGKDIAELTEPELRVSALSAASENILKKVNGWQKANEQRFSAYQTMSVWDKDSFGKIHFDSRDIGHGRLGHIIENNNVRNGLIEAAKQENNITLLFNTGVKSIHNGEEQVLLTLEDGLPVVSKLLIAADGANSWVRKQLNLAITFSDYDHHAVVATIDVAENHQQCARQVFLPDGPLALLPLWQENQCSIVWSTSPEHAKELVEIPEEQFNRAITAATDSVVGPISLASERVSIPLTMRYANQWLDKRVVLMGDAAHTIHPLAGLGMNLGLLDAASIVDVLPNPEILVDSKLQQALRQYERWRKSEAQTFIAAMAGLKELFAGSNPVKKLIRGAGLALTNSTPMVKDKIIQQAMGLSGGLPKLAKTVDSL